MATPFILIVCIVGVFCLTPLAMYLFGIALLGRRDRPTVVSGPWDFAALAAGLSGFVLIGGGLVLTLVQPNFRYWMRGNFESLRAAWGQDKSAWLTLSFAYVVLVTVSIAQTLAARRRSLVVYNIDTDALDGLLAEVFGRLGRGVRRSGYTWWEGDRPVLGVETFPAGRTATLNWLDPDPAAFAEFDRHVRAALAQRVSGDNPASRWLMAAAGGLTAWAACCLGLLLVYVFSGGR